MAIEIERKFLVIGAGWLSNVVAKRAIRQAYLARNERVSVRVRIVDGSSATLNMKSRASGIIRSEYEYSIPPTDAEELLGLREGHVIEKVRHIVPDGGVTWEIDVFSGENAGLVVAELELATADQDFRRPAWVGAEVSTERKYYNADLALRPYSTWSDASAS